MEDPKRTLILDAAKQSFSLFGYKGTTMGNISKIAGVGKGTLYLYFESKEELLNEIVKLLVEDMKRAADAAIRNGSTVFEKIHDAIYEALMYRRDHELLIRLAHEEREFGSAVTGNTLMWVESQLVDYIAEMIKRGIATGVLKQCDPQITAFLLYKMYVALVYDWEQKHPSLTDEQILEIIKMHIMSGLSAI